MVFFFSDPAHAMIKEVRTAKTHIIEIQNLLFRHRVVLSIAAVIIFWGGFVAMITLVKKPVQLSYAGDTCATQLTLLPSMTETGDTESFSVEYRQEISFRGLAVVSLQTCFSPSVAPTPGQHDIVTQYQGWPLPLKHYELTVTAPPIANVAALDDAPVPTSQPLTIPLSHPDKIHTYALGIEDEQAACQPVDSALSCDISPLALQHGQTYDVAVLRGFKGVSSKAVATADVTTLTPLSLEAASFDHKQTIYDQVDELAFRFDKPLATAEVSVERLLGEERTEVVEMTVTRDDRHLRLKSSQPLPRQADYRVTISKAEATDGSNLEAPITRLFTLSGGPQVQAVSIGGSSAPHSGVVTLTFDQPIANTQDVASKVRLQGANATVSAEGDKVWLHYSAGVCQALTLMVDAGLTSPAGVTQEDAWRMNSRTQCYTVSTVGTSQQGRAIHAYTFGSGSKTYLFHGALHGNEANTKALMDAWIAELDARPGDIPAGVKVVVVPLVNPDGYAAGTRANARNVDLNRNFATSDWKKDVETVYGDTYPGGGGASAMSERESQVLASLTQQLAPRLTLSYHSVAGYVIANTCGDSVGRAATYSQLSGYRNMTGVGGAFEYEITGTYDDWACEKLGLPSILIELSTTYDAEMYRNRAAMWQVVRS